MKYKYKIKEYKFDDDKLLYKAFYKWFIFWHPITYCWGYISWTAWCQTKEYAQCLIQNHITKHTKTKYKITKIIYLYEI